ncbi:hypothetical protein V6N13_078994 [Hibiscus sabdariffa]|uniref:Uncharacterized protein n=1 Tax=Hibiscus sabdariffa TaxID=183260 RepID=A0ABR2RQF8_9ROSI
MFHGKGLHDAWFEDSSGLWNLPFRPLGQTLPCTYCNDLTCSHVEDAIRYLFKSLMLWDHHGRRKPRKAAIFFYAPRARGAMPMGTNGVACALWQLLCARTLPLNPPLFSHC